MHRICLLLLAALLLAATASTQRRHPVPRSARPVAPAPVRRNDTTIKNTTLEVYQLYQPEIKPVTKAEVTPVLPSPPTAPAPQQYEVPQQTLYYAYRALPLRPLALGKDSVQTEPQNYALFAAGNLATILGEVGIGSLHGRDWQSAISARYITQTGPLDGQVFRSFRLNGSGTMQRSGYLLEGGLSMYRDNFGRYGYDHDARQYDYDQIKTWNNGASITLGAQNTDRFPRNLTYHPTLRASLFGGGPGLRESKIDLLLPATKKLDEHLTIGLGIQAAVASINPGSDSGTVSSNFIGLQPILLYTNAALSAHLGLYPTIGKSGTFYLLPDLALSYRIGEKGGAVSGGWKGHLVQNTAEELLTTNPFVTSKNFGVQTHSNEVYSAFALPLGKHLNIWGRAAWWNWKGLPLFISTRGGDGKDYSIVYDPQVQAIEWGGGVRYAIGEDFFVTGEGAWYSYYKRSYDHAYGAPAVRLKSIVSWHVAAPLLLSLHGEVLDKIWGLNAQGYEEEARGVFDFGASGEYNFSGHFSALLRTENILGRKNERWLGYPSFGFNIYGGLRYRF